MIRIRNFKKGFSLATPLLFFILALNPCAEAMQQDTKMAIPDVTVYNQDGKRLRFYSDLIKGKLVAINFIFTSCTYICPMQGATFSKLQAALGDRLGSDVHLISISIDSPTDTSERLKAWSQRYGAKPGWTFVTGEKSEIDKLLEALTGAPGGRGEHSAIALIGNDGGTWIRAYGMSEPERYIEMFEQVRGIQKRIMSLPRAAARYAKKRAAG